MRRGRHTLVLLLGLALGLTGEGVTAGLGDQGPGGFRIQSSRQSKKKSPKRPARSTKKATPPPKPAPSPQPSGASEDIDARRRELEALKLQLERERAEAEKIKGKEKKVLSELQSADRELTSTRRYLKKLADQEQAIHSRLGQLELDIAARESELGQVRTRLGRRLREMYKTGHPGHGGGGVLFGVPARSDRSGPDHDRPRR